MYSFLVVSLGLLVSCVVTDGSILPAPGHSSPKGLVGRIVNGTKATLGQFPQQVSLRRRPLGNHFCGGSIVDKSWVLTAAHCMYSNKKPISEISIKVVAGQIRLNAPAPSSQNSTVDKIFIHPKYDDKTLSNDVALLRLTSPFRLDNSTVKSIVLRDTSVNQGTMCFVSGWGYRASNIQVVSNDLLYVVLPIVDRKTCGDLIQGYYIPDGSICAGYKEGGKDACQGDSGGGMICDSRLTGIVSGGIGCALPKTPGFYTEVYQYRKWIQSTMSKNSQAAAGKVPFLLPIVIGLSAVSLW
ncbi:trypsin-3 [Orussus abietinus]|uniref:trypsin-3 n=1 Tax=Orussus abietinus TaxID=222816 RepID=UPI0006265FD7|nr:trypsin-3 [Orussus abietinus]